MNRELRITEFLEELNDLTSKYGIYISTLLNNDGTTKDNPYLIPVENGIQGAGYRLQDESGEIIFEWY